MRENSSPNPVPKFVCNEGLFYGRKPLCYFFLRTFIHMSETPAYWVWEYFRTVPRGGSTFCPLIKGAAIPLSWVLRIWSELHILLNSLRACASVWSFDKHRSPILLYRSLTCKKKWLWLRLKRRSRSGFKLFDTLVVFLKEIYENVNLKKKSQQTTTKIKLKPEARFAISGY